MTANDLPADVQQAIKGVLDYLLSDDREAQDYLDVLDENDVPPARHVWGSITTLENFIYNNNHDPKTFALDFCDRS